jgi:hypothetical protein
MPTRADYQAKSIGLRMDRLRRTPDEIATAIAGKTEAMLGKRPVERQWSPTEIICHVRDVEELFRTRFHTILALDDPKILTFGADPELLATWGIRGQVGHPLDPDRWAEDRQYARSDPDQALTSFRRHRMETLGLLDSLTDVQWLRGGIHLRLGRLTLGDWVASLAAHDDNHLDQLERAVDGRV